MQIKNLSSAQTFGTVIASLPDDMPCTSHCCVRAGEPIKEWLSQEPVVLDYVSGMPLLVIYEAESYSLYYLDRVFKLRPVSGFQSPRWMPSAALTSAPRVPMCFHFWASTRRRYSTVPPAI